MDRLLSLISQGLGLEKDCLKKKIGERASLYSQANYYPPCPDPELTMGIPAHNDIVALTVLLQSEGVTGLQVIKDEKWVPVDPVPHSFVVNLADQIQVAALFFNFYFMKIIISSAKKTNNNPFLLDEARTQGLSVICLSWPFI